MYVIPSRMFLTSRDTCLPSTGMPGGRFKVGVGYVRRLHHIGANNWGWTEYLVGPGSP